MAVPLSSEMHAIIYINSQGSHDLKVIDYIQYEGEKRISLPIQLPIQEHLASENFDSFVFFFYGLHKLDLPAQKTEENLFWQLNPHNNYANSA